MKLAVIGAGVAGLLATKYGKNAGFKVKCYEQTDSIGGTWVFEEGFGVREDGVPIHTAMYRNLRTNLPKQLMGFLDFPLTTPKESYVTQPDIYNHLERYVNEFDFKDDIFLQHQVQEVKPISNDRWLISTENLLTNKVEQEEFDYVFVCNGHHWVPNIPNVKGIENFTGLVFHSYAYRNPEDFRGKKVLTIGFGPSGRDVSYNLAEAADHVYMSTHCENNLKAQPMNLTVNSDVDEITECGEIKFTNGAIVKVDVIIFCTGYKFSFPFLPPETGIKLHENHIQKLFKHCINIEHPSMFFIGVVFPAGTFLLMEEQVRFVIKLIKHPELMPSKEFMLREYKRELEEAKLKNLPCRKMHEMLIPAFQPYFEELDRIAKLDPLPSVLFKLSERCFDLMENEFGIFRRYVFEIIDDDNFNEIFN